MTTYWEEPQSISYATGLAEVLGRSASTGAGWEMTVGAGQVAVVKILGLTGHIFGPHLGTNRRNLNELHQTLFCSSLRARRTDQDRFNNSILTGGST